MAARTSQSATPLGSDPGRILVALDAARSTWGRTAATRKLAALRALARATLPRGAQVQRLHEILCFMRAYPDSPAVLRAVERMLAGFARRDDLVRHREALADSGIPGTTIEFRFFWPTARWLVARWGRQLRMDWSAFEYDERLEDLLPLMTLFAETPALDEIAWTPRQWIERLRGRDETDAAFLVRRFEALPMDEFTREKLYDQLDPTLRLSPGPDTPSRSREKARGMPVVFQVRAPDRSRPDLAAALRRPIAVRDVSRSEGARLIDLARAAMVTRQRDLDIFSWGDPADVRVADGGGGVRFAVIGAIPERRLLLESVYGMLTLKNGVPIGYVLVSALFGSSEIAYNVFETWRGTEAAGIYARVLAVAGRLFGSDTFTIFPYQLGEGNDEALDSGAWWFYRKLGFAPVHSDARRLMRSEEARMRGKPGHRSSRATLARLARENLFFHAGRPRSDVMGRVPLPAVGLAVQQFVSERFGSDRERAARTCRGEAEALLGAGPTQAWSAGERLAWDRWAPVVCVLPGVPCWSGAEKRALAEVIRAKGGRREAEFVRRFDAHTKLRAAVRKLALAADAASG